MKQISILMTTTFLFLSAGAHAGGIGGLGAAGGLGGAGGGLIGGSSGGGEEGFRSEGGGTEQSVGAGGGAGSLGEGDEGSVGSGGSQTPGNFTRSAPSNSAVIRFPHRVSFAWSPSSGATSYRVHIYNVTACTGTALKTISGLTGTSHILDLTELPDSTTSYRIKLIAVGSSGEVAASNNCSGGQFFVNRSLAKGHFKTDKTLIPVVSAELSGPSASALIYTNSNKSNPYLNFAGIDEQVMSGSPSLPKGTYNQLILNHCSDGQNSSSVRVLGSITIGSHTFFTSGDGSLMTHNESAKDYALISGFPCRTVYPLADQVEIGDSSAGSSIDLSIVNSKYNMFVKFYSPGESEAGCAQDPDGLVSLCVKINNMSIMRNHASVAPRFVTYTISCSGTDLSTLTLALDAQNLPLGFAREAMGSESLVGRAVVDGNKIKATFGSREYSFSVMAVRADHFTLTVTEIGSVRTCTAVRAL